MHIVSRLRRVLVLVTMSILALALTGCPSKSGPESKFMGTWQNSTDPGMVIEVKGDHKAVMKDKSGPTEVTWEASGDEKMIIHGAMGIQMEFLHNSDGTLRDTMTSSTWKKK